MSSHEMEFHPNRDAVRCRLCGLTIGGEALAAHGANPRTCVEVAVRLAAPFFCEVRDVEMRATPSAVACPGCGKPNDVGVKSCWCCGGKL